MYPPFTVPLFNRDISWLSFNHRVLQEAADPQVPLYERIRFLSIFSSNLDEFFRVRMPEILTLHRLKITSDPQVDPTHTAHLAGQVQQTVGKQLAEFGSILREQLLPELHRHGIHLCYNEPLQESHDPFVREYFLSKVLSFVQPVFIEDPRQEAIFLENNALYFAVSLTNPQTPGYERYAIVNIPSAYLPRFTQLPNIGEVHYLLFLDDVVRQNLPTIFPGFQVNGCYSIKLTRDAEMNLEDEYSGDLAEKIEQSLFKRELGLPTRFLFEATMPVPMQRFLQGYLGLSPEEMIEGGRYHNLKDLASLPNPTSQTLTYARLPPLPHPTFGDHTSIFETIRRGDQLFHLPYHSYNYILRFFNEASIDPEVEEISVTLYRVAANSHIANALISAAKNKKKVTVFVELKARFDEANNLNWSKKMKAAGVKIIKSIPGLKVHAKIALVKKRSGLEYANYGLLATGNFNEGTARFYTDQVLLTANQETTRELAQLFAYLRAREEPSNYPELQFGRLLVSQFNLIPAFIQRIDREIAHARAGKPAYSCIKLNNLQEQTMIGKLYEASRAGVQIDLLVRSICCLVPQLPGWSDRIRVVRLVDRYLEHSRIFWFHNDGQPEVFLGSADWMNRNLHRRIEVCFPVTDAALQTQLKTILDTQLADNTNAVLLTEQQENRRILSGREPSVNAQTAIYQYVKEL